MNRRVRLPETSDAIFPLPAWPKEPLVTLVYPQAYGSNGNHLPAGSFEERGRLIRAVMRITAETGEAPLTICRKLLSVDSSLGASAQALSIIVLKYESDTARRYRNQCIRHHRERRCAWKRKWLNKMIGPKPRQPDRPDKLPEAPRMAA